LFVRLPALHESTKRSDCKHTPSKLANTGGGLLEAFLVGKSLAPNAGPLEAFVVGQARIETKQAQTMPLSWQQHLVAGMQ
jgi:hypothetical protein